MTNEINSTRNGHLFAWRKLSNVQVSEISALRSRRKSEFENILITMLPTGQLAIRQSLPIWVIWICGEFCHRYEGGCPSCVTHDGLTRWPLCVGIWFLCSHLRWLVNSKFFFTVQIVWKMSVRLLTNKLKSINWFFYCIQIIRCGPAILFDKSMFL